LNKTEYCINLSYQTLNKTESCINQTIYKVLIWEVFVNLTCINWTPFLFWTQKLNQGGSIYIQISLNKEM
jgi:hypothetical protein